MYGVTIGEQLIEFLLLSLMVWYGLCYIVIAITKLLDFLFKYNINVTFESISNEFTIWLLVISIIVSLILNICLNNSEHGKQRKKQIRCYRKNS